MGQAWPVSQSIAFVETRMFVQKWVPSKRGGGGKYPFLELRHKGACHGATKQKGMTALDPEAAVKVILTKGAACDCGFNRSMQHIH